VSRTTSNHDAAVTEFRIAFPQAELDDLKSRLARVRWPDEEPVGDWTQGVPLVKAKALIAHWRDHYDWRPTEDRLNGLPHFKTTIDGLGIHFLHIRSRHEDALPMVMTHGWPGSFMEFERLIGPLVDPTAHGGSASDAFHLVIPSLPGHGFSDKPTELGWDTARTAKAWSILMTRLGYDEWVAHGYDWGSIVTHWLAAQRPPGLLGAHSSWPLVFPKTPPDAPDPEEQAAYDDVARFTAIGAGYQHVQRTRPQTLGYALADSPVGQALWMYEKFAEWSDNPSEASRNWSRVPDEGINVWTPNDGTVEDVLGIDAILDGITLYWLTNSGASSARYYWENGRASGDVDKAFGTLDLPMSGTVFPQDEYRPPRHWAEASWPNLVHWGVSPAGGHFTAWEQPTVMVEELRKSFGNDVFRRPK
jgi:pimeloyl-ACP methyl ester carboxylesterase